MCLPQRLNRGPVAARVLSSHAASESANRLRTIALSRLRGCTSTMRSTTGPVRSLLGPCNHPAGDTGQLRRAHAINRGVQMVLDLPRHLGQSWETCGTTDVSIRPHRTWASRRASGVRREPQLNERSPDHVETDHTRGPIGRFGITGKRRNCCGTQPSMPGELRPAGRFARQAARSREQEPILAARSNEN